MQNEKIIIIGSGFSGSILARKIAEELNRQVFYYPFFTTVCRTVSPHDKASQFY